MNLLITGSNGFVGKSLSKMLLSHGHTVTPIHRDYTQAELPFNSYQCLIHLAGRAHVMYETSSDIYSAYREVNVEYTLKTAALARSLGVKRIIFLSTIKVNGEVSRTPYTELDAPAPLDAYGQTKLEAEIALKDFSAKNQMELVIIRPPLIYGGGVKANFRSLIQLCKKPIPMPFGHIHNKRSLVSLENLNSFIELCCHHPHAANQTFLISDDHDISTTELINTIKGALGQKSWQVPIPVTLLKMTFSMLGKQHLNERLLGNLQVDISKAKQLLHWQPVISFDEGIKRTVHEYAA